MDRRQKVIIAEVTRMSRSLPSEVLLTPEVGMPTCCVINTDALHTIPKGRLRQHITTLGGEHVFALNRALAFSLDLEL